MPRIKSAKKRQRQTKVRTDRNKAQRSSLRTAVKKVRSAATEGEAASALKTAESLVDRAGRKNLIHKNTAARTKSRMAKLANSKKA